MLTNHMEGFAWISGRTRQSLCGEALGRIRGEFGRLKDEMLPQRPPMYLLRNVQLGLIPLYPDPKKFLD